MSIRKVVVAASRNIDRDTIEKIRVCLAPSLEDARWYILQRHSSVASNQIRWQRLQQQRFIISTYDSTNQDIEKTIELTGFKRAAIIDALRYVKIRDMATYPEIMALLDSDVQEKVLSHKISMTVLERWFGNSQVRAAWHIDFDENGATFNANKASFCIAYAAFLRSMFNVVEELGFTINTRTIDSKFKEIIDYLPKVKSEIEVDSDSSKLEQEVLPSVAISSDENDLGINKLNVTEPEPKPEPAPAPKIVLKGNPRRLKLTDKYHGITSRNYKLNALFDELTELPIKKYSNVAAASIRIFLELSVDEYISSNELNSEVAKNAKKLYSDITLSQKLSILRGEFIDDREANKVIAQLLTNSNDHSLNTLNEYVHGSKVHKVEQQFLNGFWDMLTPLFAVLINMRAL